MATDSQNSYSSSRGSRGRGPALTVFVGERGIEQAMRVFKKLIHKEGLLKDLKRREHYEKPGDRKRRKQREAVRRRRRQAARTRGRIGGGER
jgi:small subunit ribosomal protein S21